MKRILSIFITICIFSLPLSAQSPSWVKKAAAAVFTLKTFAADGTLLGSSNGFFISAQGDAVSSFTPFKGAQRAVVIDSDGNEWPVEYIVGASEMYDVAKFQVTSRKVVALPIASTAAANGAKVWLLPYAAKKSPTCVQGTVSSAEQFEQQYSYYTLSLSADEQHLSSPVLNDAGEVIGLLQNAAEPNSTTCYAVSALFAANIQSNGLTINDPALRTTAIAKALPEKYDDALLSLYMGASVMNQQQYTDYLNRFIQKFPEAADGYIYRARQAMAAGNFADADKDMQQAVSVAEKKDDAHFQYAQLIFQKELYHSNLPFEPWSLDRALQESAEAYANNPLPVYRQQQAQILYAQKKYDEAFMVYDELSRSALRSADIFFAAAQCKLQQDDKRSAIQWLDSAVCMFSRPYVKTVAPYLRVRAELSMDIRRYQQAINDMNDLVILEPNDPGLWAEKASYELRVNLLDQALESATQCLQLDPQSSDGMLMIGIVQCIKGNKQQGLQNLQKAQALGNGQAQSFIEKYQ